MEYRPADLIELHEPGIRLLVHDANGTVGLGFTDDDGTYYMGKNIVLE